MISKKRALLLVIFVTLNFFFISCINKAEESNYSKKVTQKIVDINTKDFDVSDISSFELTLSRGAFHWDSFQIIGNKLTYLPSKENDFEDHPQYQKTYTTILSDNTVASLIKEIIAIKILALDAYYDNEASCSSKLKVAIKVNNIEKKIVCEDFEKGCPKALIYLERRIVLMHGKNLKRISLPG